MTDSELEKYGLKIEVSNAYDLAKNNKEDFVRIRRNGLGASDSSVVLGVNLYTSIDELIAQKLSTEITPEEIEVGNKPAVRKGADLEPLILSKFEEWSGVETYKPDSMYRFVEHPQLTVNFDGVIQMGNIHIPVEAKYVSSYAGKYWGRDKAINKAYEGNAKRCAGSGIVDHINLIAEMYGIPAYYYTQVQQQLLGLHAPFGYLVALFDKDWEISVFKIFEDKTVQEALCTESDRIWNIITERKRSR